MRRVRVPSAERGALVAGVVSDGWGLRLAADVGDLLGGAAAAKAYQLGISKGNA